ncbi:MAG TPA: HNH endonuclease signature motif containing protein [Marmoricola sp.]|nr:HNH endonuclease signature motif containing protein [Marmoricola sp.]HNJ78202.1 HNH endonuclease signature motif containing protein [Marmoricola sp.]HNO38900.1 HNH endonuclease signature motif containing protein [Marmoricola sp.]
MIFLMDTSYPFPYEFLGRGPRIGDVVHRFGCSTVYLPFDVPKVHEEAIREAVERDEVALSERDATSRPTESVDSRIKLISNGAVCLNLETGASLITFATDTGLLLPRRIWAAFGPSGERLSFREPFKVKGRTLIWTIERIRHWEDDQEWRWEAPVCVPHPLPHGYNNAMQTPESLEHFAMTKRISANTTRNARRMRMVGVDGTIERIDPISIYERDNWICGLCHELIDRELKYPDMNSVSLDHIIPLAANGTHTSENVQAAHLNCNIAKGARY